MEASTTFITFDVKKSAGHDYDVRLIFLPSELVGNNFRALAEEHLGFYRCWNKT